MTFLPAEDVQRITKRTRYSAQRRALARMGYAYTVAANGEPLVRWDALDAATKKARNAGPRWDRIGEPAKPAA